LETYWYNHHGLAGPALEPSVAARRTALTHTIFNVLGTIIFLPLFLMGFFEKLVVWFTNYLFVFLPGFAGPGIH
jgi:phosphate:Na+ symporter